MPASTSMLRCRSWLALVCLLAWSSGAAPARLESADAKPAPIVACVACAGTGSCAAPGCMEGKALCPNTCLKKEVGKWEKKVVAGHPPDELWQEHPGHMWTQHHLGELIVIEDGKAVNKGKCPTCSGKTRVDCRGCGGNAICAACQGSRVMTKEREQEWKKQAKAEASAQSAWDKARAAELAAGEARSKLEDAARGYQAIAKKFPETRAGKRATEDAQRLAKALAKP